MKRVLYSIVLCLAIAGTAHAQWSAQLAAEDADYQRAISLYQQGQYAAAQSFLRNWQDDFFYLACAFELRQPGSAKRVDAYLHDHPYTPYLDELHYMAGVLWVEQEKYKKAIKEFQPVKQQNLFRQHQAALAFYQGYAYLQQEDRRKALDCFRAAKASSGIYATQARYYYAYTEYLGGNYRRALPDFLALEAQPEYSTTVPYYLIQIYYAEHDYDAVLERADKLLKANPDADQNAEVYRILGEIAYERHNYREAAAHLKQYEALCRKAEQKLVRQDMYLLGMASYYTDQMSDAATYLRQVSLKSDSITQSTQLHLGHVYRRQDNVAQAGQAYAAAMRLGYSDKMREEAMYNYALCTMQTATAMGESVDAFDQFLREYPESEHQTEVYSLLSDMYRSAKNYDKALTSLLRIQSPTAEMLQTAQYFRYKLGADAFVRKNYKGAIRWFDELLAESGKSGLKGMQEARLYAREAYYWKAESLYRLGSLNEAKTAVQLFQQSPDAQRSENYLLSQYLMGYILFKEKDYAAAQRTFDAFVRQSDGNLSTCSDALCRAGDCAYAQRDFVGAEGYYTRVIAGGKTAVGVDYAMYQRGYTLGLLRRYSDKVTQMDQLVRTYPKSDYADNALYEVARAEVQRERPDDAIAAYARLLDTYPKSALCRKASLETALLYYNNKEYAAAIRTFKGVVKDYPGTEEATSALEGLENCYVETNDIPTYLAYRKTLGDVYRSTVSSEDSVSFAAAERQYIQGKYAEAAPSLALYLQNYCPAGRYCAEAHYFLADAYYRLDRRGEALQEYMALIEIAGNNYMEEAVLRAAEITYDQADYSRSLLYFTQLEMLASSADNTWVARLGALRSSYLLGDQANTIRMATVLLDDNQATGAVRDEALYHRGKAFYRQDQLASAAEDFRRMTADPRTAEGAEAAYLRAECLYRLSQLAEAEQEVMTFADSETTQQYWLARAFILLSDIYQDKGESYQAEQFLLSLQQSYSEEGDDIPARIAERLSRFTAPEEAETVTDDAQRANDNDNEDANVNE